ncbi:MAG: ABC transporter permease [Pseudomonadota bacterium]
MGTDHLGRDIASRMLHGARISIGVGAAVVVLSCAIGVMLGLLGGYLGRAGDALMRVVDGMLAFPELILALALIAALGSSIKNVIIALTFVFVPRVARSIHANVLSMRSREFVMAAVAMGCSRFQIAVRHLLPQALGLISVQATFIFAHAVISEASLTFLGVGLPPGSASWGAILSDGRDHLLDAPWITTIPGLAILILVLCLNILGDNLRDGFDPRAGNPRLGRARRPK